MKKILFLLLICFIKLSAYEYLITKDLTSRTYDRFYLDKNGKLTLKTEYLNDNHITYDSSDAIFYSTLDYLKFNNHWLIGQVAFNNLIKGDSQFYNDMYVQKTQPWLNYLYNNNHFNSSSHIVYDNYQILYNEDGLAVESIIGGVWRGLYDSPENSGYLYDREHNILYDNGHIASLFKRFWYNLTGNTSKTLKLYYISMLSINVFLLILAVYLVKVLLTIIYKWCSQLIRNTRINVNLGAQKRW